MNDWAQEIKEDLEKYVLKNFVKLCKELGYHVSVAKKYAPGQPDKTVIELWKESVE